MGSMVEVYLPSPSHVNFSDLATNRISKSLPRFPNPCCHLPGFSWNIHDIEDPLFLCSDMLSDHSLVPWSIETPCAKHRATLRLEPAWTKHPEYRQSMPAVHNASDIDSVPPGRLKPFLFSAFEGVSSEGKRYPVRR